MIGQIKYAWIDFRRSFGSSFFQFTNLVLSYFMLGFSFNAYYLLKAMLYWRIPYTKYIAFRNMSIIFIALVFCISIIITVKTAHQKFLIQKRDIGLMKNVGGRSQWIYSYIMFSHMITGIIAFVLGIFLSGLVLLIILGIFNLRELRNNIKFVPVFLSNIFLVFVHYIATHYQVIRYIEEEDFKVSTRGLSDYKSIFEFEGDIKKYKPVVKMGIKIYLRSGDIISSLFFIFLLAVGSMLFLASPITIGKTTLHEYEMQYEEMSFVIGEDPVTNFFQKNMKINKYNETEQFRYNNRIDTELATEFEDNEINRLYLEKLEVEEINFTMPIPGTGGEYDYIGKDRKINAVIIGYEEENLVTERLVRGRMPDSNKNEMIIGESLENYLFEDIQWEKMKITGVSKLFSIVGVVKDNFASGFTVYLPLSKIRQENIGSGSNCILVKNTGETNETFIQDITSKYAYSLLDIKETVKQQLDELKKMKNLSIVFSSIIYLSSITRLITYGVLHIRSYKGDYELLYKIGIRKKKIENSFAVSLILLMIPGIILGLFFSSIFNGFFIIENPELPNFFILLTVIICSIVGLGILGLFIGSRGIERKLKNIRDNEF